jgi:hypothetical protein
MDEAQLEALLEEATAHSYDEEDEFWGVFSALMGRISYPLEAQIGGETVTLIGLDGPSSTLEAGITAQVEKGGAGEAVPLSELEAVNPDPDSATWLAMYKYWRAKRG